MSDKIRKKQDILLWLHKDKNSLIPLNEAHELFKKETGIWCELRLFKKYKNSGEQPGQVRTNRTGTVTQEDIDSIELVTFRAGEKKLQKGIFVPYTSGLGVDRLFSVTKSGGGPMKGTVTIATGGPGVGKSTVIYHYQARLQEKYPQDEICCLQSEMRELDLEWELSKENEQNKPWMAIPNFVLLSSIIRPGGNFRPELAKAAITKVFKHGYDVLFIDSFEDLVQKLVAYADMKESHAETFLLGLIEATCDAKNDRGVHTAIIAIQQETKGGVFKGSNKLKHAITGMLHMKKDKRGERYITFSKNRRSGGNVDKAMFFGLDSKGELVYDVAAFEEAETLAESLKREKERLNERKGNFVKLFAKNTDEKIELSGKLDVEGPAAKRTTKKVIEMAPVGEDDE